jgi:hypothetical protein
MSDWFADLDRAKALGLEYAQNGIAGGQRSPEDSPLSGEWADGITPNDIIVQLGGDPSKLEDWEIQDVCDNWEDGYLSAEWPETPLVSSIKQEIRELIANGTIPETVGSFSELHDYCDANMLGGTEDLLQFDDEGDSHIDIDELNAAQDAVDAWIKSGRQD